MKTFSVVFCHNFLSHCSKLIDQVNDFDRVCYTVPIVIFKKSKAKKGSIWNSITLKKQLEIVPSSRIIYLQMTLI